ncbi:unnamed protein product [Fusarium equiseti]|uniref:Uncharacterized protein n=1 Tax=Fusarium equiseti TaxID=61235 RepID=A0A8J2IZ06_FUSEQ|nr:unnamed protein product [Fusarium equiseti]
MSSQQKRSSKGGSCQPNKKRRVKRAPGRDAARRDEEALNLARACLQACPELRETEVNEIPGVSGTWELDPDQLPAVERLIRDSNEMRGVDNLNDKDSRLSNVKTLWKTSLRIFRYSPNVLLSHIDPTEGEGNPSRHGLLAYPVESRDLNTECIWEAFKLERGATTAEFPRNGQLRVYIQLSARYIYAQILRLGVIPSQSPEVDDEGAGENQISSQGDDSDDASLQGRSPSLGAGPLRTHDTDERASPDEVYPTMSGVTRLSVRQRRAGNQALTRLESRHNELRAGHETLEERVQAIERQLEVGSPSNEALLANNERLRQQVSNLTAARDQAEAESKRLHQQNTQLEAQAERHERDLQILRQFNTQLAMRVTRQDMELEVLRQRNT